MENAKEDENKKWKNAKREEDDKCKGRRGQKKLNLEEEEDKIESKQRKEMIKKKNVKEEEDK